MEQVLEFVFFLLPGRSLGFGAKQIIFPFQASFHALLTKTKPVKADKVITLQKKDPQMVWWIGN